MAERIQSFPLGPKKAGKPSESAFPSAFGSWKFKTTE